MLQAIETQSNPWNDKVRCPSIKKMAEYIKAKHPEYEVQLRTTSCIKTTKPRGYRYTTGGGTRDYTGLILTVLLGNQIIIEHDTTETYRLNVDVASKIIELEQNNKNS